MKKLFSVLMLAGLLLAVSGVSAATFLKQENFTAEMKMMGQTQPARTDTMTTWLDDGKAAMFTPEGKILFLDEAKKMYMIDDAAKTYMEVPLKMIEAAAAAGNSLEDRMAAAGEHMTPEQKKQMEEAMKQLEGNPQAKEMAEKMMGQMMGGMDKKGQPKIMATVTKTGESETINGWDAEKYVVDMKMQMGEGTQEVWAAPELEFDQGTYQMMRGTMMSSMEGFDEFIEEMKKIDGVPVKSKSTMKIMGAEVNTTSRLLEYKTDTDVPAGMFELPEGYTKQEMMQMGMGGGK